jgi:hypothetical protein
MANYAEQLAYWYLRLNGFFLIQNYVYHQIQEEEENRGYNADADLLAIRPPYYYEEIPQRETDENGRTRYLRTPLDSDDWLREFEGRWLGVIVEVKGSDQVQVQAINRAFTRGRLEVSLNRLGLTDRTEEALHVLSVGNRFDYEQGTILKMVFSQIGHEGPWLSILLNDANRFIINRMSSAQNYLAKSGSRYFFPSELIQYMIWSSRQQRID